jgi:hypothetical protein
VSQAAAVRTGTRIAGGRQATGTPVRHRVPQPRLRVVAPAPSNSRAGLAVLSITLLAGGLLALLVLNISLIRGSDALSQAQLEQRTLAEARQRLQEQVESSRAPQQLAERARALGMVPAPNTAFVQLSDGKVLGRPAAAAAAPVQRPTTVEKPDAGAADAKKADTKKADAKKAEAKNTEAKNTDARKTDTKKGTTDNPAEAQKRDTTANAKTERR